MRLKHESLVLIVHLSIESEKKLVPYKKVTLYQNLTDIPSEDTLGQKADSEQNDIAGHMQEDNFKTVDDTV